MIKDDIDLLRIASDASRMSTCIRTKVGALLVLGQGKVAAASNGHSSCTDLNCLRADVARGIALDNCRGTHAEVRAILNLVSIRGSVKGGVMYCTHAPCGSCARLMLTTGISRLVYLEDYPGGEVALEILREAGIIIEKLEPNKTMEVQDLESSEQDK